MGRSELNCGFTTAALICLYEGVMWPVLLNQARWSFDCCRLDVTRPGFESHDGPGILPGLAALTREAD